MGDFKTYFLAEDKRSRTKKFLVFKKTPHQQILDVEMVRNIIVHKLGKMLSPRMNKPVEEIADNIRLRKITQMGTLGDHFQFKYSLFSRPFAPYHVQLHPNDYLSYSTPDFKTRKSDTAQEQTPPAKEEQPKNEKVYKCKFPDEYGDVVFVCKCTPEDPNVDLETLKKEKDTVQENFIKDGKRIINEGIFDKIKAWKDILTKSPVKPEDEKQELITKYKKLAHAGFKSSLSDEKLQKMNVNQLNNLINMYKAIIDRETKVHPFEDLFKNPEEGLVKNLLGKTNGKI